MLFVSLFVQNKGFTMYKKCVRALGADLRFLLGVHLFQQLPHKGQQKFDK